MNFFYRRSEAAQSPKEFSRVCQNLHVSEREVYNGKRKDKGNERQDCASEDNVHENPDMHSPMTEDELNNIIHLELWGNIIGTE